MNRSDLLWLLTVAVVSAMNVGRQAGPEVSDTLRTQRIELIGPAGEVVATLGSDENGAIVELKGTSGYAATLEPTRLTLLHESDIVAQIGTGSQTSYLMLFGAGGMPSCHLAVTPEGEGEVSTLDERGAGYVLGSKGLKAMALVK